MWRPVPGYMAAMALLFGTPSGGGSQIVEAATAGSDLDKVRDTALLRRIEFGHSAQLPFCLEFVATPRWGRLLVGCLRLLTCLTDLRRAHLCLARADSQSTAV